MQSIKRCSDNLVVNAVFLAVTALVVFCGVAAYGDEVQGEIAFVVGTGWDSHLYVMDAASGSRTEVPLPSLHNILFPKWCQDGTWLTFQGGSAPAGSPPANIHVVKPDGLDYEQVTSGIGDLSHPSFSPDASQILFSKVYGNLYTINRNGTGLTDLDIAGGHAAWSPDGSKIVCSNWGYGGNYDSDLFVHEYDEVTDTWPLLTTIPHPGPGEAFTRGMWSPDSTRLAVVHVDHSANQSDIWVMNADGSGAANVTSDWATSDEGYPSWSPDGQYIVFQSDHSGESCDIWAMRPDGSDRTNLTNTPLIDEAFPAIVPEPVTLSLLALGSLLLIHRRQK